LKGKEIIEHFVNELKDEGITHVDRWADVEGEESDSQEYHDTSEMHDEKELPRLNADYIKNYLGELTPMQESRLLQMRKKLEEQNLETVFLFPISI
jgi:hypothetical protein